jgi:hypothetical protein
MKKTIKKIISKIVPKGNTKGQVKWFFIVYLNQKTLFLN